MLAAVHRRVVAAIVCLLLAGCPTNRTPLAPTLEAPTIAQRGDSVRVSAYSFDPESDSLSYLLEWGDGTQSGWVGPLPPGTACGLAHVYRDTGMYGVRAESKDAVHETDWSDTSFIHVGEYGPNVPHRPAGPDTVPVGDSVAYVTAAGHPLLKRVAFRFDWGDGDTSDYGEFVNAGEIYSARHVFSRGGLMAVRARAKDTLEHVSDWSKPESVIVVDTFRFRM